MSLLTAERIKLFSTRSPWWCTALALVASLGFTTAVAGKSGTAETPSGNPDAWFIGFAPYDGPKLAIATLFEEKPGLLGSQDAGAASRAVFAAKFGGTP